MSAPQLFQSSDPNAPAGQSNVAGTLVAVLDALLVNGYTTFSVTSITRGGSTATVTATSHGLVTGEIVRIAGAAQTEYNVDAVITKIDANTFTYAVGGTPATPATGTITGRKAPAGGGWTIAYTGTNKRAYRAPAGNRFYLRVDDSAAATAYSRVRVYETMSDVDTGTGPVPTEAQVTGGNYIIKSDGSSARTWKMVADNRAFWMWLDLDGTPGSHSNLWGFGDFPSYKSGDAYNTFLMAFSGASYNSNYLAYCYFTWSVAQNGLYLVRSFGQAGGSITFQPLINPTLSNYSSGYIGIGSSGYATYPEPVNGGLIIDRCTVMEPALKALRGYLPGLWYGYPARAFGHGDIIAATGTYAGKQLMQLNIANTTSVMVELTDWWT